MRCDFCLVERASLWGFPVDAFFEPVYGVEHPVQEWAACDDCAAVIGTCDSRALASRVIAVNPDKEFGRDAMVQSYRLLFSRIAGPMERCTDQTTPLKGHSGSSL